MSVTEKEFNSIIEYARKTPVGYAYYDEWKKENKKEKSQIEYSDEYNEWWITYPASERFEYKGKKWTGTRALRDKKEQGWPLYQIARKDYTAEQLLNALKCEVEARKIESYNHKDPKYNALHYMKATTAYLNIRRYEMWINETIPVAKECRQERVSTDIDI